MATYRVSPEPTPVSLKLRRQLPWWIGACAALSATCFYLDRSSSLTSNHSLIAGIVQNAGPFFAILAILAGFMLFIIGKSSRKPARIEFEIKPDAVIRRYPGLPELVFPIDHIARFSRSKRWGSITLLAKSPRASMVIPQTLLGADEFIHELQALGIPESHGRTSRRSFVIMFPAMVALLLCWFYFFFGHSSVSVAIGGVGFGLLLTWSSLRSGHGFYVRSKRLRQFLPAAIILLLWLGVTGMRVWSVAHPRGTRTVTSYHVPHH